ncbi:hypothetical protein LJ737_20630 [Hymenobacter sp. 15J16-1T3B]|uniref:hypothetical protein n=1 Tax=Hymenobacter sp. 15J16-1T3B TaxID=2886941 RepID=UPI001D11514B|nr:hypothetical protein [Hymenobacter sp. 15J16-1T3B]MCC3159659.1 hypothetical protein [Hymenobacter sp. 15J16-1T3B]
MDTAEKDRLKAFILDHFPFDELKEMGFWQKGTRRNDYEAQAARVCHYFGYKSVYEYGRELPEVHQVTESVAVGKFPDTVSESGELKQGGGFMLTTGSGSAFECPACTCPQDATDFKRWRTARNVFTAVRCQGCKRPLEIFTCPLTGKIEVSEKPA